ncbi:DNA/RNA polymerases superfamily protein [Gossypium australe]|uniref:DNA/RNA polymerases superfamily protein n=1 Tax=Gossypium australe TaxID=47621 RepID=A0A5B6V8M8_9ROSI|nr:DNA/RNA polymerases superfamily protein [Gossypium australe]
MRTNWSPPKLAELYFTMYLLLLSPTGTLILPLDSGSSCKNHWSKFFKCCKICCEPMLLNSTLVGNVIYVGNRSAEFVYNSSFQYNIQMAPYEVLYGRRCKTTLCWS